MTVFLYIAAYYILVVNPIESAKILAIFPVPSISHQVVFRPLTQELVRRGHEVTVITTDPAFPKGEAPSNLTEIDVHDISYGFWIEEVMKTSRGNDKDDIIEQMYIMLQVMTKVFEIQLNADVVQNLIHDKRNQFDLLLIEACIRPALAFSQIFKAPVIQVSSFGATPDNYRTIGAPVHQLLYPTMIRQRLFNLTMWEKIKELYKNYKIERYLENYQIVEDEIIKKHFGSDMPSVTELSNNVHMLFLNVHPMFEGIRPVPPSVVYMGGLHQKPENELPMDLKAYLDTSKNGVIYISFGTNVDPTLLPPKKIQTLVKVFSQLPYDVLWKWNKDELPGRTENIRISKWLPQSDLLGHPKVKLFITQGGLQSTDEAITAGVPLIGMPMLGDQWFNVEKYVYFNIGIRLDMETLSEEKFRNAITTVIEDESYKRNIVRLRTLMRDEPQRPLERAVWWTEYVLRHGGAEHLRSPAANITWTQYLEIELVLTLLAILFIGIALLVTALYFSLRYVTRNFVTKKKIKSA